MFRHVPSTPTNPPRLSPAVLTIAVLAIALLALAPPTTRAGGPKFIAGTSFFNPAVLGQPLHWANGQLNYYVDQGPLSATVTNQQATAMVDAAAALWSAVPTAAVTLTDMGPLNEDVNGSNIAVNAAGQITEPSDVTPSATNYPLAVLYDADGSVINALSAPPPATPPAARTTASTSGSTTSTPTPPSPTPSSCSTASAPPTPTCSQMMSFELERAFGRVLGLDFSQVNPGALTSAAGGTLGWPVMQPLSGLCGAQRRRLHPQPQRPAL